MHRILFADRRVWLLALLTLSTLLVGRVFLPASVALTAVVKTGYWFVLLSTLVWGWTLWNLWHRGGGVSWLEKARRHCGAFALIAVIGGLWQAHETHGFKIVADEPLLLGTSQSMHLDRDVGYPVRATDVQGPFQILQGVLDKRPFFFPFVVSVVHDLTGYRASNPFWVNTALSFVFLTILYGFVIKIAGLRSAGIMALVVVAGLPLLAQQAAGAGFELLNLTLATAWWWLAMHFLERPEAERQDAFILTSVLLASTRYESLLFLVPTAFMLVLAWWRSGRIIASWPTWSSPLLMLPMLWLNHAFSANDRLWELQSLGADTPFGLKYLAGNLGHALAYFFSLDGFQPNSPYLGLLGLLALPVFVLWAQGIWRSPLKATGQDVGLAFAAVGPMAVTGLMMVYFWGQFDHPVIRRLSLPTQLLMVIALVVVVARVFGGLRRVWSALICGGVAVMFAFCLPSMAKNVYGREYSPGMAYEWRREFLARQPERDFLMIDRDSIYWIAEKISATPNGQAQVRKDGIAYHMRNHSFSAVYVFQTFKVDPETGKLTLPPEEDLGPDFELEPVAQRRIEVLRIGRFSRVTAIREGTKVLAKADQEVKVNETEMTPAELDAAKRGYLDRWVKELP